MSDSAAQSGWFVSRLSPAPAAIITIATMALATIPTPLYPAYSAEYGVSSLGITALFATFALGAIGGLATMRSPLGKRWTVPARITAAGLLGAAAAVVLSVVPGIQAFAVARFLCGAGVGIAAANSVAFIVSTANVTARHVRLWRTLTPGLSMLGLALGPASAGILVGTGMIPRSYLYAAVAAVLGVAAAWMLAMPKTPPPPPSSSAAAQVAVSSSPSWPHRVGALSAFSITGLFGALTSHLLTHSAGGPPSATSVGVIAAVPFLFGALASVFAPRRGSWQIPAALLGILVLGISHATRLDSVFVLGAALAGTGGGALFGKALLRARRTAPPGQHVRAVTDCFIWAYVGLSLPIVAVGSLLEIVPVTAVLAIFGGALAGGGVALFLHDRASAAE